MSASGLAGLNGIFEASALIFFAFIGFETITRLSEETKNPTKTMPKALILSIFITTIIYIFVAVSAISVLDWSNLSKSKAPLADVASSVFGPNAYLIISVIALFATFNTVLAIMLGTSRLIYGMATQNIGKFHGLAWFLCSIYEKTKTPWASIMVTALFSIPFVLTGNIKTVANMTNFTVFVTFILVNASVIWFRYKKPNIKRGFKTPINIGRLPLLPVLGIIACLFMLLNVGFDVLIYGFIIMLVGFAVYWITNKRIEK